MRLTTGNSCMRHIINKLIKSPVRVLAVIAALAVVFIAAFWGRGDSAKYEFVVAEKRDLLQEVSVTGKVEPAESVELGFEKSGKVSRINAKVGDKVNIGQILAQLENAELSADLLKAEADVKVQEAQLAKSRVALGNYYADATDVLNDAYTKANDAVRRLTDEIFTDDEGNPLFSFSISNTALARDAENLRMSSSITLNEWKESLDALGAATTSETLEAELKEGKTRLKFIRGFLDQTLAVLQTSIMALKVETIAAHKSNLNTGKGNVNTALAAVGDKEQDIATQKASVVAEEASLDRYKAAVQNIRVQIAKTILRAPIKGIVIRQDAKVGEIVAANGKLIILISDLKFEIEANVPEADIAKLKINDPARATLDAYGSDLVFEAKITAIDPAETVIDGVATYKITLQFAKNDGRIKSGMTANIDIQTAKREGVIVVPQRAIATKDGNKEVRLLRGNEIQKVKVLIGLRGSDGGIEVVDGVNEGDKVIVSPE